MLVETLENINMQDEYCWTIFTEGLLASVYTDEQKAKDHLNSLIEAFPNCIKTENEYRTYYGGLMESDFFFFMTKRKLNVPLIKNNQL
jgi:hypothetical protein